MAKKLSKSQKARKRVRKQANKLDLKETNKKVSVSKKSDLVATINVNGINKKSNTKAKTNLKSTTTKKSINNTKTTPNKNTQVKPKTTKEKILAKVSLPKLKENKQTQIVEKKKREQVLPKLKEELPKLKEPKKEEKIVEASYEDKKTKKEKEEEKRRLVENTQVLYNIFVSDYMKQNKKLSKKKVKKIYDYEEDDDFNENPQPRKKSKHFIVNAFFFCKDNMFLLYNTILGLLFIFVMIGLIEVNTFAPKFIIYVGCLLGFLVLIAMSYNKYFSGRLLSILLSAGMIFSIYKLQYNYDFLDSLDHRNYEIKTYYVVTFDNNLTKKIYSLTGKKVGILTDNKTNIERRLNIKVEGINYMEYNDFQELINTFYKQGLRAVIVTPNQYKYLANSEDKYGRKVKVLYTFEAVSLK